MINIRLLAQWNCILIRRVQSTTILSSCVITDRVSTGDNGIASVRLFPLYLLNWLTFVLDRLHVCGSWITVARRGQRLRSHLKMRSVGPRSSIKDSFPVFVLWLVLDQKTYKGVFGPSIVHKCLMDNWVERGRTVLYLTAIYAFAPTSR